MYDTTQKRPLVISGRKEDLDTANLWVRAVCHSALGHEEGDALYRKIPALPVLLAYRYFVDTGVVH